MAIETVYVLAAGNITVSGGQSLSGITQGTGVHLLNQTITLNNNNWEAVSINDNDADFEDNDTSQTLNGTQVIGGVSRAGGLVVESEYALRVVDPDGVEYRLLAFNIREPGSSPNNYSTIEGLAFVGPTGGFPPIGVPLTVVQNFEFPSDPYPSLAAPPCFCAGTSLLTPQGYRLVDDLAVGDLVMTLDHAAQPIRWIGVARLPCAVLVDSPKFRPVMVRKGAFGHDCPSRDLMVSPQHRILVTGWQAELLFGETEILVPAIKLANDRSIRSVAPDQDVTYYHVMCDGHEIVWADGLASESFLPGLAGDSDAAETQGELDALFPHMTAQWARQTTIRPCISDKRTQVLRAVLAG